MATNQKGLLENRFCRGTRNIALAIVSAALAGCAANPTEPRSAGLDKWDGEPVVTTTTHCIAAGCMVRSATSQKP